jgi:hypothetical protein
VLLRNEYQLLEGLKQEGSSTRPYATMTPQTAKNRLRANPAGHKSMKKQIDYLKKKLEADIKTMKTRLVTVVFVNSWYMFLVLFLTKNGMLKRQLLTRSWR